MSAQIFTGAALVSPALTSTFMTILAQDPDPSRVATIRWLGIAIMVIGLAVIFLRWWRER
ncbi:MAG: hypothetical protein U0P48_02960 [Ancrocorticia sp.]